MSFQVWLPEGDRVGVNTTEEKIGTIPVGRLFYCTLQSSAKTVIHQGGESSGKTINILIALAYRAATQPNIRITVTSQSFAHLRAGAMSDFKRLIEPHFSPHIDRFHKTINTYFFKNGSRIEFMTFDDEIKARGPRRDWLYINEANSFPYMTYLQLSNRTFSQVIIDYNPSARFWAHEHLIGQPETEIFYSDHRQNLFLSEFDHRRIENYKDEELFRVYGRGATGNIKGIIYPNWTMITDEEWRDKLTQTGEELFAGVDFGYTNDPMAGSVMFRVGNNLYIKELFYEAGMPVGHMVEILKSAGLTEDNLIVGDSADPGLIRSMNNYGGIRVIGANKKPGYLVHGIYLLKQLNVFYVGKNIKHETERYLWEVDNKGETTNVPIDAHNHQLDGIRMVVYKRYFRDIKNRD